MARSKEELGEVRTAARERRDKALVRKAVATFPPLFGIRGMPTRRFALDEHAEVVVDGRTYPSSRVVDGRVQLMILMREDKGKSAYAKARMIPFAKASPEELRRDLDMREIAAEEAVYRRLPLVFHLRSDPTNNLFRVVPGSVRSEYNPETKRADLYLRLERDGGGRTWRDYGEVDFESIEDDVVALRKGDDLVRAIRLTLVGSGSIDYGRLSQITGVAMPSATIPKTLQGEWTTPEGIHLRILPASGAYAKHRTFVQCSCGEWTPLGRFNQHVQGSDHKRRIERKNLSASLR